MPTVLAFVMQKGKVPEVTCIFPNFSAVDDVAWEELLVDSGRKRTLSHRKEKGREREKYIPGLPPHFILQARKLAHSVHPISKVLAWCMVFILRTNAVCFTLVDSWYTCNKLALDAALNWFR